LALACVNQAGDAEPPLEAMSLESLFEDAAAEFDVPADLLMAVGFAETGWEMVEGGREFEGVAPAYGVMGLRGDRLTEAAALAGVDPDGARYDEQDNIRAAAALLSRYADEAGIERSDLAAWAPVVARYSGIDAED